MIGKWARFVSFGILALAAMISAPAQTSKQGSIRPLAGVKFEADRDVLCLESALEAGNPDTGPSTFVLIAKPGCQVPWHSHTAGEQLIVIRGTVPTQMKGVPETILEAGGFAYMRGKEIHRFSCKEKEECIMVVAFDKPYDIFWAPTKD